MLKENFEQKVTKMDKHTKKINGTGGIIHVFPDAQEGKVWSNCKMMSAIF